MKCKTSVVSTCNNCTSNTFIYRFISIFSIHINTNFKWIQITFIYSCQIRIIIYYFSTHILVNIIAVIHNNFIRIFRCCCIEYLFNTTCISKYKGLILLSYCMMCFIIMTYINFQITQVTQQ